MRGVTCGVWPSRRSLVAVVVDEQGRAEEALHAERGEEGAWSLLALLDRNVGLDWELVVPSWLARHDALAKLALSRGVAIWLVPDLLAESVRIVANLATGPPARTAAALARLPLAPALRGHLRRHCRADRRQLPLF